MPREEIGEELNQDSKRLNSTTMDKKNLKMNLKIYHANSKIYLNIFYQ